MFSWVYILSLPKIGFVCYCKKIIQYEIIKLSNYISLYILTQKPKAQILRMRETHPKAF